MLCDESHHTPHYRAIRTCASATTSLQHQPRDPASVLWHQSGDPTQDVASDRCTRGGVAIVLLYSGMALHNHSSFFAQGGKRSLTRSEQKKPTTKQQNQTNQRQLDKTGAKLSGGMVYFNSCVFFSKKTGIVCWEKMTLGGQQCTKIGNFFA